MTEFEKEVKWEYLDQFLESGGYPVRINPEFNGRTSKKFEEEIEVILFIIQEMPYLECYHDDYWNETMVKQVKPIPAKEQLFYYKHLAQQSREDYWKILGKVENIISGEL